MTSEAWKGRLAAAWDARPIIGGRGRKASLRRAGLGLGLLLALTACHRGGADWRDAQADPPASSEPESDYVIPPKILAASRQADGSVMLSGRSKAGVRIRLSSPDGAAYGATAGQDGGWSVLAPPAPATRLFGLSEDIDGRMVQGEGYIAVLPPPGRPAMLLRAGGGAVALDGPAPTPEITAVDFDAGGATVISGMAQAGQPLKLTLDEAQAPESRTDNTGRFTIGLTAMVRPGDHTLTVEQAARQASAAVHVSHAAPIAGSPYRGAREANDWRVDWTTPGGGVQTTLVIDRPGASTAPSPETTP